LKDPIASKPKTNTLKGFLPVFPFDIKQPYLLKFFAFGVDYVAVDIFHVPLEVADAAEDVVADGTGGLAQVDAEVALTRFFVPELPAAHVAEAVFAVGGHHFGKGGRPPLRRRSCEVANFN